MKALLIALLACTWAAVAHAQPDVVGHRGTGVNSDENPLPENTLESVEVAVAEGADLVELDVQRSADGVLVIMHDATVDRTTDGTGCVADATLAELQLLDAAQGTPRQGTGVAIPTLSQALAAAGVPVNIELKVSGGGQCPATDVDALARDVVAEIRASGGDHIVSSFESAALDAIANESSEIYLGLLTLDPDDVALASERGYHGLHLFSPLVMRPEHVDAVRGAGLVLQVWTENDPSRLEELDALGVDAIITDEPDLAADIVGAQGQGGCSAAAETPSAAYLWLAIGIALAGARRRRSRV